ncbi:unnamed protein product [Peniophora sp. CBMAI 1063]|nr:unnamed protein product [Peniophora sp. CBMAI 1063]
MTSTTFSDSHPSPSPTTAFSPFSTPHSHATDFATSDESPDLGAFRNVFRTFHELQPRWPAHLAPALGLGTGTPPTTDRDARGLTPTDLDSSLDLDGAELHSTVWAQQPVARYLDAASPPPGSATPSSSATSQSQSRDYGVNDGGYSRRSSPTRSALVTHDLPTHDLPRPTLGGLDAAFEFLANERARLAAQRASLPAIPLRPLPLPIPITFESSLEPESPITPGRSSHNNNINRRRRKRRASSLVRTSGGGGGRVHVHVRGHDADFEDAEDSYDDIGSPLSPAPAHGHGSAMPATPSTARRLAATADTTAAGLLAVAASTTNSAAKPKSSPLAAKDRSKSKALAMSISKDPSGSAADYAHRLHHARSTPVLRTPAPQSQSQTQTQSQTHLQQRALDPQRVRLRALAIKLKFLFPGDAGRLARVLAQPSMGAESGGVLERGGGDGMERDSALDGEAGGVEEDFADVRGPSPDPDPGSSEPITHVFVD